MGFRRQDKEPTAETGQLVCPLCGEKNVAEVETTTLIANMACLNDECFCAAFYVLLSTGDKSDSNVALRQLQATIAGDVYELRMGKRPNRENI